MNFARRISRKRLVVENDDCDVRFLIFLFFFSPDLISTGNGRESGYVVSYAYLYKI